MPTAPSILPTQIMPGTAPGISYRLEGELVPVLHMALDGGADAAGAGPLALRDESVSGAEAADWPTARSRWPRATGRWIRPPRWRRLSSHSPVWPLRRSPTF